MPCFLTVRLQLSLASFTSRALESFVCTCNFIYTLDCTCGVKVSTKAIFLADKTSSHSFQDRSGISQSRRTTPYCPLRSDSFTSKKHPASLRWRFEQLALHHVALYAEPRSPLVDVTAVCKRRPWKRRNTPIRPFGNITMTMSDSVIETPR